MKRKKLIIYNLIRYFWACRYYRQNRISVNVAGTNSVSFYIIDSIKVQCN